MKIGEIARASGISPRMIRHYESLGLIPNPGREASNYRSYAATDLDRLRFIRRARDLGFPLPEIASLISLWQNPSRASAEVKALALARARTLQTQVAELEAMRASLEALAAACHGDDQPECAILSTLAKP
ncbi:Cu(I)-responsive transcriptional regulator [Polymorphobacter multimanifer]|uniref:Cu(I)-responsive transcriptional regulator n=1 Tax=Polymorphobacter multimanifer TaxID=1070431 RepID=A0A841L160_9SPHN|nr:MerR family DNA-binding protein [Polymorphobacter multimanifer]MBB6226066.1 Cu(I)-responsive transcriptional regulator [Polymorphobacter multimanifer]GGI83936.1 Cu(I)-responsive transcriptional regulator [Polymorphobacter multimanifer]